MKEIRHDGIVEHIGTDGHVRVRITQMAACAGCKVAAHCNAAEQKVKTVDVYQAFGADRGPQPPRLKVGDAVVVATSGAAAGRALLLAFGLPLMLLLVVLAALLAAGVGEGTSALAALAILAPYYLLLWLCRDKIAGKISFHLEQVLIK